MKISIHILNARPGTKPNHRVSMGSSNKELLML